MTERATGRHRAPTRPATPLSSFTSSLTAKVGDRIAGVGRGGLVLAMSSGLVASMGMPAGAVPSGPAGGPASGPADSAFTAPDLLSGSSLTVPVVAEITFDRAPFTTIAKPKPQVLKEASRSIVRSALTTTTSRDTSPGSGSGSGSGTSTGTSTSGSSTGTSTSGSGSDVSGSAVLTIAARYLGVPYRYGGTTPSGFDCSGYVQYVYRQLGVSLPRTADQQMNATTRISRSSARAGDLVFFVSGGNAYHVGIYAGSGMIYESPRPGESVIKREIWSASVVFGRV